MKNTLIVFILMFSLSTGFAQLGIKGGINFSNITTDDDNYESLEAKVGFQAGVMLKLNLSDQIAIQPEANYTRKGAKYEFFGADVTSNMDYLDIPVLLILTPFKAPIQIQVGPQFSYLLQTNVKYENILLGTTESYSSEKEDFEDYDLGLNLGVGFNFGQSIFEVRYSQGLKKYEKEKSNQFIQVNPASKHFNIQASFGVFF